MSSDVTQIRTALAKGPNIIYMHSNADLDCVGAASTVALFYGYCTLCCPGGPSHLGKRLAEQLGLEIKDTLFVDDASTPIAIDAQDDSSLGYTGVDWSRAIVVDHHRNSGNCRAAICLINEEMTSSCELIWEIMDRPREIERKIALALMAGLLADTGHLKRGTAETLLSASEILKASGLSLEDIQSVFETAEDQDMSRRISRLKGAQRMKFDRIGEWIVATTETGAFEAAACHALLALGADVAFAGSQKEDEFRITGRAHRTAVKTGIHLGDMFSRIATECGGEGGGHDGAAGFSGTGDLEAMLGICSQNAMAILKGKPRGKSSD